MDKIKVTSRGPLKKPSSGPPYPAYLTPEETLESQVQPTDAGLTRAQSGLATLQAPYQVPRDIVSDIIEANILEGPCTRKMTEKAWKQAYFLDLE